jgi:peroxiredoxin
MPIKRAKAIVIIFSLLVSSLCFYFIFLKGTGLGPEERGTKWNSKPKAGDVAPDFALPTLMRNSVRLSDYRGKVVFLNFWATWCPPCREEMPSMESLYQRLKDREFEMFAVSIDRKGEEAVRPFMANFSLTFPVLLDPDEKIYKLYRLTGIPETFIIEKIDLKIIGAQNWTEEKWLDYFDRLIGQK